MVDIGLIGCDTSHVPAFAKILNKKKSQEQIKFAFPGGTKDFSMSHTRVDKFTNEIKSKYNVLILNTVEEVGEKSDAIIITSCDGRQHLEQFEKVASLQKPVFIDKPLACSSADAKKILELSEKYNTPVFINYKLIPFFHLCA